MRRISGRLAGGGAFLLLALACNPEKPVGPQSPTFDAAETLVAPLVLHTVAPQTTDPAIDRALDNHYVWLDTTAKSNRKLFVFLPGTGQNPSIFQLEDRGVLAGAGQEHEELAVRLGRGVEPDIVIVERPIDGGVGCLGRYGV